MVYKNLIYIIFITIVLNITVGISSNTNVHVNSFTYILLSLIFAHTVEMICLFNVRSVKMGFMDMLSFMATTSALSIVIFRPTTSLVFDIWFFIEITATVIIWYFLTDIVDKLFGNR